MQAAGPNGLEQKKCITGIYAERPERTSSHMRAAKQTPESLPSPAWPSLCAASGSAFFVIQRPEYPDWYAGGNEYGPMWTSSFDDAFEVPADMLLTSTESQTGHSRTNKLSHERANTKPQGDSSTRKRTDEAALIGSSAGFGALGYKIHGPILTADVRNQGTHAPRSNGDYGIPPPRLCDEGPHHS